MSNYVRFRGNAEALYACGIAGEHHAAILGKVGKRSKETYLLAGEGAVRVAFDGVLHAYFFLLSDLEPAAAPNAELN